jgi:hypothetical protein
MGWVGAAMKAAALMYCAMQVGACAHVPAFGPMGEPIEIQDVVQRVECEIYDTVEEFRYSKKHRWITNYVAKATLALTVTEDGTIAPEVALLGPWSPGTFAVLAGGSIKGSTERLATYAFTIDFSKTSRFRQICGNPKNARLHGTIGFHDWFRRVLFSRDRDDPFDRPTDLSHKLDFQVDAGLRLVPAYQLLRSKGEAGLSANRSAKNSVDFTMIYNDPDAVDYQRVCVVNIPGPCYEPTKVAGTKGRGAASNSIVQQRLNSNTLDLQIRSLRLDQLRR